MCKKLQLDLGKWLGLVNQRPAFLNQVFASKRKKNWQHPTWSCWPCRSNRSKWAGMAEQKIKSQRLQSPSWLHPTDVNVSVVVGCMSSFDPHNWSVVVFSAFQWHVLWPRKAEKLHVWIQELFEGEIYSKPSILSIYYPYLWCALKSSEIKTWLKKWHFFIGGETIQTIPKWRFSGTLPGALTRFAVEVELPAKRCKVPGSTRCRWSQGQAPPNLGILHWGDSNLCPKIRRKECSRF